MGMMTELNFTVTGVPVPEGSLRSYGPHRLVHSNNDTLRPWREAVAWHCRRNRPEEWNLDQPFAVEVIFWLPKPPSIKRPLPTVKPDLDKLVRAVLDAMTGIAYCDDSRVVGLIADKRYGSPGVSIAVRPAMT